VQCRHTWPIASCCIAAQFRSQTGRSGHSASRADYAGFMSTRPSLARPGGNVTGISSEFTDLGGKRLELLHEVVPGLHRLGILGDYGNRSVRLDMNAVAEFARGLGMEVVNSEIRQAEDVVPSFAAFKDQAQALYIASGPLVDSNRDRINGLALADRLPTMHGTREQVEAGGLIACTNTSALPNLSIKSYAVRARLKFQWSSQQYSSW
ncbi:MAG: ABC transporter substrate binding protein, partial [Xanthobacteraceae bacterium]